MDLLNDELDRRGYLFWNAVALLIGTAFSGLIDATKHSHTGVYWTGPRVIFSILIVMILLLAVSKRLRSIKQSQWLLIVFFLPIAGILLWAALFFIPPKKSIVKAGI